MTSYPGRRSFETLLQPINTKIFIVSNARGYTPSCGNWHHGLAPRGVEMESNSRAFTGPPTTGGGGIRAGAGDIFLLYPALVKNISFKTKHVHNFVKQRYLHRQLRALPQTNTLWGPADDLTLVTVATESMGVVTPPPPPHGSQILIYSVDLGFSAAYSADSEVSDKDDPNCCSKPAFHPFFCHKTGLCKWNVESLLQIHSYVIEKCKKIRLIRHAARFSALFVSLTFMQSDQTPARSILPSWLVFTWGASHTYRTQLMARSILVAWEKLLF